MGVGSCMRNRAQTLHCGGSHVRVLSSCPGNSVRVPLGFRFRLQVVVWIDVLWWCSGMGVGSWERTFPSWGASNLDSHGSCTGSSAGVSPVICCSLQTRQLRDSPDGSAATTAYRWACSGVKIVCGVALVLRTRLSLWSGAIFSVAQFSRQGGSP